MARPGGWDRREFLRLAGLGALGGMTHPILGGEDGTRLGESALEGGQLLRRAYEGPNIFVIRYGGGVRRRETIDPKHTYSPYLCHELIKRGVLYSKMEIDQIEHLETSHGEGTLNILTGRYDRYRDVAHSRPDAGKKLLGARFEAKVPTIFEHLREAYDVPDHETLIVNGEDRGDEEFYNFSNHHLFGVQYRSQTLSLRRYKMWLWRRQLTEGRLEESELKKRQKDLAEMEALDYRASKEQGQGPTLDGFWEHWREQFGDSGLKNDRGDRLLTQLTLWAMQRLRPRLVMVNYQDCDYVHWGYMSHYTNGIRIMDDGIRQLVSAVEADPFYRDNTVFAIVPDCGRDDNPFMDVPLQHHFGSRSAHDIFGLFFGAGIPAGIHIDRTVRQVDVAPTLAAGMKMTTPHAEGGILSEVWS